MTVDQRRRKKTSIPIARTKGKLKITKADGTVLTISNRDARAGANRTVRKATRMKGRKSDDLKHP